MARMATASSTQTDEAHEAEVAAQAEIAAEVDAEASDGVTTTITTDPTPPVDPAPEVEAPVEQPTATIVPTDAATYPLRVSLVGLEDELVFESASDSKDVPLAVAEQVTYLPSVEVVK